MQAAYLLLVAELYQRRLREADRERLARTADLKPRAIAPSGRGRRFRAILADLAGAVRSTASAGGTARG